MSWIDSLFIFYKPNFKKIIITFIFYGIIETILYIYGSMNCFAIRFCKSGTEVMLVPGFWPGNYCRQICIIPGYEFLMRSFIFLIQYLVPLIIIYSLVSIAIREK